ncbi:hypothetical protein H9M94_01210 [Mycoplasma sp. Pen4]|uniref:MAG3090 family protein n=1 Tax=Mycoplasma sp. Pen4 TaxID=640330 RepID=UPI0016546F7D|nr:hypothetical protein [Mycoplasma sp. Pen4]QNM93876.1 hypothetical protein H9M94_01210 [Mycoplasma sp. Pen4]
MKRLQCLYRPNKDKNYPWALKHPKVDSPLALFKTRKDAMTWFLSLGYDCATWFQTDKKIWGGLLIDEAEVRDGKEVRVYEFNVDKFDGNLDHNETAEELNIDPETGLRKTKQANKDLKAVVDFKILRDHETYFPVEDDFKIERKKSAKDLLIEKLNAQILELTTLLKDRTDQDYSQEIQQLYQKLQDSNSDKEELLKEIEELKRRSQEQPVVVEEVVEQPVVEVVEEVQPEVIPVVVEDKITEYKYVRELPLLEQIKVLAIYARKLEKLTTKITEETFTSVQDVKDIEANFEHVLEEAKYLREEFKDDVYYSKLLAGITYSLTKSIGELSERIIGKKDIEYSAETALYSECCLVGNIKVSQRTSYVLFNHMHVGFVPQEAYIYAIFLGYDARRQHFLVFDTPFDKEVVTVEKEVPAETQPVVVKEATPISWLAVFLLALAYGILVALVILFAFGIIDPIK